MFLLSYLRGKQSSGTHAAHLNIRRSVDADANYCRTKERQSCVDSEPIRQKTQLTLKWPPRSEIGSPKQFDLTEIQSHDFGDGFDELIRACFRLDDAETNLEDAVSGDQAVAAAENGSLARDAVDERAIPAAKIVDGEFVVEEFDLEMSARHRQVSGESEVIGFDAAH